MDDSTKTARGQEDVAQPEGGAHVDLTVAHNGLSTEVTQPRSALEVETGLRVWLDGELVERLTPSGTGKRQGGGIRGTVEGFSRASRSRLMKLLAKFSRKALVKALFVGLTYHDNFQDATAAKGHLRAFVKRVRRAYGEGCAVVWKMELQERGAIHFHLLLFGVSFIPYDWIAQQWVECSGQVGDRSALESATSVERVKDVNRVKSYVCKYLGKAGIDQSLPDSGRWWGKEGDMGSFLSSVLDVNLTRDMLAAVVRTCDQFLVSRVRSSLWIGEGALGVERWKQRMKRARQRSFYRCVRSFWYLSPGEVVRYLRWLLGGGHGEIDCNKIAMLGVP